MNWIKKMYAKKMELLGSRRFWMLTFTAVLAILKLETSWSPEIMTILQQWLIAVAAIGTMDSFGSKIGGLK